MTLADCYAVIDRQQVARSIAVNLARRGVSVADIATRTGEPLIWVQAIVSTWWHKERGLVGTLPRCRRKPWTARRFKRIAA